MDILQQYIHKSRYARWLPDEQRRETWSETVQRYTSFWARRGLLTGEQADELALAIFQLEVMPSMRCMMTAGEALSRDNVAGYNCSYVTMDHPRAFDEILYILMCGTGVGFSVERRYTEKLPEVSETFYPTITKVVVHDSKIGWAKAFRELLALLWQGQEPEWDMSAVRPAGAPLKTFGGRASGPEPLDALFRHAVATFRKARGRRLSPLEVHDLVCKVADVVVVGGVRRSALISLSDLEDSEMRHCKSGNWWQTHPHRALANNSYVSNGRPVFGTFLSEWMSLYESQAGERGIFNRAAATTQAVSCGREQRDFGTNPCSEIILRPQQFCNLSEVVVRAEDTIDDLCRKVRLATILGTLQSTLVDFRYLRSIWRKNTEEERLLGVSLTGITDHAVLGNVENESALCDWLITMRRVAQDTNKEWAEKLGIPQSAAITCVKPSGTVSQLVDSSSGIHPRFAAHYIRRVRGDKKDPVSKVLIDFGVPYEEDKFNPSTWVFSFPVTAPPGALKVSDVDALYQLRLWDAYQMYWCDHKPSCTVYYSDDEFLKVGEWVWDNFGALSGISFLPKTDHIYAQAPYEEVPFHVAASMQASMPKEFDWRLLSKYELEDQTISQQTLACAGGVCEL